MEGKDRAERPRVEGDALKGKRVVVGLSGGLDSTVSLYLLKKAGAVAIGITLILLDRHSDVIVPLIEKITEKLGVPLIILDQREEFKKHVIEYFVAEYRAGRTPNPCGMCNRLVKFRGLYEAMRRTSSDLIATGHYARIVQKNGKNFIAMGSDRKKDQSYFLALIEPELLDHLYFPLGEMKRDEVRKTAEKAGLVDLIRPESQEICFLTGESYRDFLEREIGKRKGRILSEEGEILGEHEGFYRFTLGQRRGTGVAGGKRLYVLSIDPVTGDVILGDERSAYRKFLEVKLLNQFEPLAEGKTYRVRIRQNHEPAEARIQKLDGQNLLVSFEMPQWAPAPGQIAAFYEKDVLLAGGIIEKAFN